MFEIERHIESLLLSHECVIIPGFGGFVAHYLPARYDATDGVFLPPLRTIGFNQQLNLNDYLLAQSFIDAYDISYPEAIRRIEEEVNQLRQILLYKGSYTIHNLGKLSSNVDGNIEFSPCEAGALTPSLYALSFFEITPLSVANTSTSVAEKEKVSRTSSVIPQIDIVQESANNTDNKIVKLPLPAMLRDIAAAAIILVAFILFAKPYSMLPSEKFDSYMASSIFDSLRSAKETATSALASFNNQNKQSSINEAAPQANSSDVVSSGKVEDRTPNKEFNDKEVGMSSSEPTLSSKQIIEESTPTLSSSSTTDVKESKGKFTIVLASRITRTNAEAYAEKIRKDGFTKAVAIQNAKGCKVIYGSFESKEEATSTINMLRDNKYFEQAWAMAINR